ncbi:hypothetical protein RI065_05635 [Mycoplasmatota bacterium zrk1]
MYDRTGAGLLDAKKMIDYRCNVNELSISPSISPGSSVTAVTYNFIEGKTYSISMAYLRNTYSSSSHPSITDFDLVITDSSGTELDRVSSDTSNVERIEYEATYSGTHYIKVQKMEYTPYTEKVAVSFNAK